MPSVSERTFAQDGPGSNTPGTLPESGSGSGLRFGSGSGQKAEWVLNFNQPGKASPSKLKAGSSAAEKMKLQKHREYFFEDGNVVFQVEDTLYKLHRSLLEKHSPVFRELFTIPQPEGSTEGRTEDNPIVLAGIQAVNFTRFLWLLYPPALGSCKITTVEEWMSVVDQADRWQMDNLREHAVAQLRQLYIDPVRKILIWHRYNLPTHELVSSYVDVISRPQPLSLGEAQDLGLPLFVKIAQARDVLHTKGVCRCCVNPRMQQGFSAVRDRAVEEIVHTVIGISLSPSARS